MRARTPEDAFGVVLRLLLAQPLVDKKGLPGADRQGVCEPPELAGSKVLAKLARRVAPPSVKQHLAEQEAERERREQTWRDQRAAKLAEQRAAKLAAGEAVRWACCFQPIESPDDAAEKHDSLVHKGDCEQQWGQHLRRQHRPRRGGGAMIRPPDLLTSIAGETQIYRVLLESTASEQSARDDGDAERVEERG